MQIRVPSDVVKGVFHFLGKKTEFVADVPKIHSTFFEIKESVPEVRDMMRKFVFENSRNYQYSETVTIALDRLQKSNLLHCSNPRLDNFEVADALVEDPNIEGLFNDEEINALRAGAAFFRDAFGLPLASE
jgi:hypothetical protein